MNKQDFFLGMQGWLNIHQSINMLHHINKGRIKITLPSQ